VRIVLEFMRVCACTGVAMPTTSAISEVVARIAGAALAHVRFAPKRWIIASAPEQPGRLTTHHDWCAQLFR